ncbi:MAG: DUF448 domain-containing protein [Polyangia bacterium]
MDGVARTGNDGGRDRVPQRSCVACRHKTAAARLLRLAATPDGGIAVDWRRNLGGRGAYVCARRECVERALSGQRLSRALHRRVVLPSAEEVLSSALRARERQLKTLLSSARGADDIEIGADAARRAVAGGRGALLLLAADGSRRDELAEVAARGGIGARSAPSKLRLGDLLGRGPTGAAMLIDEGIAEAVARSLDEMSDLRPVDA